MYKINEEQLKQAFLSEDNKTGEMEFKHNPNKKFKDLPFVVKDKHVVKDFKKVTGEFLKLIERKKPKEEVVKESVLEGIKDTNIVDCKPEHQYYLKDIIQEVYFDEDELSIFSAKAMVYTNGNNHEKKIAKFLYDALVTEVHPRSYGEQEGNNIMDMLMYKLLPELIEDTSNEKEYLSLLDHISQRFMDDLIYVLEDEERIKKYLEPLLMHYYFFYISQLCIKFNQMFEADKEKIEELFFSVEWEQLSRSRIAYTHGWKKLERNIENIFSHSKLLEMLNQHDQDESYSYMDIKRDIQYLEGSEFQEEVQKAIEIYTHYIKNYDFNQIEYEEKTEYSLLNKIHYLWKCIDGQFQEAGTKGRAYKGYSNWFIIFCKANMLKNRRSLGHTLNLKEEDIILLTKMCLKDTEKIKLKDLFKGFEERGVFLDLKTKEKIHEYFEKLNLIEKKSDSGDAQYVKGIL